MTASSNSSNYAPSPIESCSSFMVQFITPKGEWWMEYGKTHHLLYAVEMRDSLVAKGFCAGVIGYHHPQSTIGETVSPAIVQP